MPLMLVYLINFTSVYNIVKSQKLDTIAIIDKKTVRHFGFIFSARYIIFVSHFFVESLVVRASLRPDNMLLGIIDFFFPLKKIVLQQGSLDE